MAAMVPEKKLIIAVEGTAALGPFWKIILTDYLKKIIRSFCGNDSTGQPSAPIVELALIVFGVHGRHSDCKVRRSGWTRNPDAFLESLSCLHFSGGGFEEVAIAEVLGDALLMLNPTQQNVDGQRHCILVATSNPYPLPTPVYWLQVQNAKQSDRVETQTDSWYSDAETVAKSFARLSISLSVISPKQLPKLKAIYNAGKQNPLAEDVPLDTTKNPHFLVLISENFFEACAALSHSDSGIANLSSTQSPVKSDSTSISSVSGPRAASIPDGSVMSPQPVPVGNIPPATGKIDQQVSNNENVPEIEPMFSGLSQALRPVDTPTGNVRILNNIAQARQALAGGISTERPPTGWTPMLLNMISSKMTSSVPAAHTTLSSGQSSAASLAENVMVAQNSAPPSYASITSHIAETSKISISQPLSDVQAGVTMGQTVPSMRQANMTGMSQQNQPGTEPLRLNNNTATTMPHSPQTSSTMQSTQSRYVKFWEGNLTGRVRGQTVLITRLEGYRRSSASETLTTNWPPTMQIVRLISKDYMNNKKYLEKADILAFQAMHQHILLGKLQEKNLCAVIQLPSQTLLLSIHKANRLIGLLFPADMVVYEPQIPSQQQEQQLQAQQHPQLQLQQLQQPESLLQLQQQQQQPLMLMQQPHQQIQQLQQQQMLQLQQWQPR